MSNRKIDKEPPATLIDRVGIGLLSAFTFVFFYGIVYGLVVLGTMRAPTTLEDGSTITFMLSLFIWGPILFFIIGFIFVVNPIESILSYFEKSKYK